MSKLSGFRMLESISLPEIGSLKCSGLIVVVGPNSSGKTRLLQDISSCMRGNSQELVVATNVSVARPANFDEFAQALKDEGFIDEHIDEKGKRHWLPRTSFAGSGEGPSYIPQDQTRNWFNSYTPGSQKPNEFLGYFGRLLVAELFLTHKLIALNQGRLIDFQNSPPTNDLQALYCDDEAKETFCGETIKTFGKAVWPDASRGTMLCLRVSQEPVLPSAADRLSLQKMSAYRTIDTEGDGLKSYASICVALLLARRPVCLIDEPEMCLHPPQAQSLGQFIGENASSIDTFTMVSTHSAHVLRGIIQAAQHIQIVRLTRRDGKFLAHQVPKSVLDEAVKKPTVRAESILDGIFADAVVVVEADSDRVVYQATLETLSSEIQLSIHFAPVGGTGGIVDPCRFYRALKIPVAVISDMDLISDPSRLKNILDVFTTPRKAQDLADLARSIMKQVKALPPTVTPAEAYERLSEFSGSIELSANWSEEGDIQLRRKLNDLAGELDRMRRLKVEGAGGAPSEIRNLLTKIVDLLAEIGIFLVPVGELEQWIASARIENSRRNSKWAWANAAALHIQTVGPAKGDIWDFIRNIGKYFEGAPN